MATVNKNFRIKNGLIVEGASGTINGQNILTETGSDQYILDLVGGTNLIDSVASGLSVTSAELSIDRTVVDTWYDASGAAATAQSNAEDYADGLAVNYDPAGTAAGLAANYDPAGAAATAQSNAEGYADDIVGNVISGDTAFTAVNVNSVAGIWAAVTTVASASTVTAWAYNSTVFTSAKLLVSIKANGHSQVSEVLVTLDSTGNVAITEFGIVGTNGSLGEITAINSSGNISIRVTTAYSNSDVIVYATTLL